MKNTAAIIKAIRATPPPAAPAMMPIGGPELSSSLDEPDPLLEPFSKSDSEPMSLTLAETATMSEVEFLNEAWLS